MALYGTELASEGIAVASIHPGIIDKDGRLSERIGEPARAAIEQMGLRTQHGSSYQWLDPRMKRFAVTYRWFNDAVLDAGCIWLLSH